MFAVRRVTCARCIENAICFGQETLFTGYIALRSDSTISRSESKDLLGMRWMSRQCTRRCGLYSVLLHNIQGLMLASAATANYKAKPLISDWTEPALSSTEVQLPSRLVLRSHRPEYGVREADHYGGGVALSNDQDTLTALNHHVRHAQVPQASCTPL